MIKSGFNVITGLVTLISVLGVVALLIAGLVVYDKVKEIAPFEYVSTTILAENSVVCRGEKVNYELTLAINDVGYQVLIVTSYYDLDARKSVSPVNDDIIEDIVTDDIINLAHPVQIGTITIPQSFIPPTWLADGHYSLMKTAKVDGKQAQFYHIDFELVSEKETSNGQVIDCPTS